MILKTETKNYSVTVKEERRKLKDSCFLIYRLYKETVDMRPAYSVHVAEYIDGEKVCQSTAYDITSQKETAIEIFDKITNGLVSPITLHDVVCDLIA